MQIRPARMRWVAGLILAIGVIGLPAESQPAKAAPPASPAVGISMDDALKAHAAAALPAFRKLVEDSLRKELSKPKRDDAAAVRLATLRAFGARFAGVKFAATEDAKTLEWVVRHPVLGPLFLTALSERDSAGRAVSAMTAARGKIGDPAAEQLAELVVAHCVVWDSPNKEGQSADEAVKAGCDVLAHLVQHRKALRFDPQALPWPVLVYLVDSRASVEDRQWAARNFRLPAEPGRAYFSIRYDVAGFQSGQFRGGADEQAYTLANILRLGGVCKDQAYFAAEVCRAAGIPAAVCTGQSGEGEGFHAWVGTLKPVGRSGAAWDFRTGRYAEHGLWSGTVIDPQTGDTLTDGEVAMLGEWCGVTREKRLLSLALVQSLDLVEPGQRLELSKKAIEAAPGNRRAWAALAAECARPQTATATLKEVAGVVERFAVGRYDDFAFKFFTALIAARPTAEEQMGLLDRAARFFPQRPDLLAELALRKGDVLRKNGKADEALKLYDGVLDEALAYGPLALDAMGRVESMLRESGKAGELLPRYKGAWAKMAVPQASGYVATTPWYVMGDRYARALDDAGDKGNAEKVRQAIRARDLSRSPPKR